MDDIDFKAKVTRSEFEALCEDLFDRVPGPVKEALAAAEMTLVRSFTVFWLHTAVISDLHNFDLTKMYNIFQQDEIEQVILVGGSTRVPKVQDVLLKAVGKYVSCIFSILLSHCLFKI